MNIVLGEKAGFCFGVKRAVETATKLAEENHEDTIYSLGEIIHNNDVLDILTKKGIKIVENTENIAKDNRIIIRAHGVGENIYKDLENKQIKILDMTCPFVKKIHNIVKKYYEEGYKIIIVGDKDHPEVIGINGWCENSAIVLYDEFDESIVKNIGKACVVAQTTITRDKWVNVLNVLIESIKHLIINDTICNATSERQNEAIELSKKVDMMFVIGSIKSSNTKKLEQVCKANCSKVYLIENKSSLHKLIEEGLSFNYINSVGITAGASTPQKTISEVITFLQNYK